MPITRKSNSVVDSEGRGGLSTLRKNFFFRRRIMTNIECTGMLPGNVLARQRQLVNGIGGVVRSKVRFFPKFHATRVSAE